MTKPFQNKRKTRLEKSIELNLYHITILYYVLFFRKTLL